MNSDVDKIVKSKDSVIDILINAQNMKFQELRFCQQHNLEAQHRAIEKITLSDVVNNSKSEFVYMHDLINSWTFEHVLNVDP